MTIRVNIRTKVNNKAIREETRNGRKVLVLPSATLPDDVVMNRILYPADAIEKGYKTLERSPAPLGHPVVNGMYVSARDPEAINVNWIGAHNENVRREGGRVMLDKVVDIENAKRHPEGDRLLKMIANQEPIHTSTGVLMDKQPAPQGTEDYDWIANEMMFDHDAILLDEPGAAGPDKGVGIFVNSDGTEEQMEVINSNLPEDFLGMISDEILHVFESEQRKSRWANIKEKLANAIQGVLNETKADGLTVNQNDEGNNMPVTDEDFKALSEKVDKLVANSDNTDGVKSAVAEAVGEAVKPLQTQIDAINKRAEDEVKEEKEALAERIANANLLDKDTALTMELNALRALAEKTKPGKAAPIVSGFHGNQDDGAEDQKFWDNVDLNANRQQEGAK